MQDDQEDHGNEVIFRYASLVPMTLCIIYCSNI